MSNKANLFPIPVKGYGLQSVSNNLQEISQHIQSIDYSDQGDYGLSSIDQQILRHPIFNNVVNEIYDCLNDYVSECNHRVSGVKIISSWSNIVGYNQLIQPHVHSNSYVCGVIHLTEGSELAFRKPNIRELFQIDTDYVSPEGVLVTIPSIPGQLILFPSNLMHSVIDNTVNNNRLSIAFNTWPKQYGRPTGWVDLND